MTRKTVRLSICLLGVVLLPSALQGPRWLAPIGRAVERPEVRLTRGLVALGAPRDRAPAVAASVHRQARDAGLDPALVLAVISVENRELKTRSQSHRGATGIMQVMPHWFPVWRKQCGSKVTSIETNVCMGVQVLKTHLAEAGGSLRKGLLFYNGCRGGEHCRQYPDLVLRRRERARVAMNLTPGTPR